MKKYFVLLIVLFIIITNNFYPQSDLWEDLSNRLPGDSLSQNLSDAFSLAPTYSWIATRSFSEMYRSWDLCESWEIKPVPTPINCVRYNEMNSETYVIGTDGSIFKTMDHGDTWDSVASTNSTINDFVITYQYFEWRGYLCGDSGKVWTLDNNGLTELNTGLFTNLKSISSRSIDNVWICDEAMVYFYNGNTFTQKFIASKKINSTEFKYPSYVWSVGDSGYIAYSSDSGQNWTEQTNPDIQKRNLNDMYFCPFWGLGIGWVVGDDGLILKTTNNGVDWLIDSEGITNNNLKVVHFNASQDGFGGYFGPGLIIGDNKTVLIRSIIVSVDDEPNAIDKFNLSQNYPNPFNPSTKIKFTVPLVEAHRDASLHVTLIVYDVLGNEIATLVNDEKPAGTYEVEFNSTGLPSGIYFYQLKAEEFIQTRKMVYLK
ncbi:MAG: YCF48-related protein [Ignavibacteriaceae bacterium]|nr:YCF48-related protein [Ignavibacteriaceae bacterium]